MIVVVGYTNCDDAPTCLSEVFPAIRCPLNPSSRVDWCSEGYVQGSIFTGCELDISIYDGEVFAWMSINEIETDDVLLCRSDLLSITSVAALDLWVYDNIWNEKYGLRNAAIAKLGGDACT